eukprot:gene523-2735_t
MCAGTVVACIFGAGAGGELSLGCLLGLFREPIFLVFFGLVVAACSGLFCVIEAFRRHKGEVIAALPAALGEAAPLVVDCVWLHDNLDAVALMVPRKGGCGNVTRLGPPFYPIVHAVFAGTVGSQSLLFTKLTLAFLGERRGSASLREH